MALDPEFRSVDFYEHNPREQIAKCREMAREAERLASNANDEKRAEYSDLARRWSALASEMERALTSDTENRSAA